jgi:serine phosphatase RsbU (regulator of sigma subunit)
LSEERLDLQSDDRLVLYTDGLTDTLAEDGRMFSLSQFLPVIQRHAHLPLAEFCPAIFADLDAYRGKAEQYDDMTLLVVEVQ